MTTNHKNFTETDRVFYSDGFNLAQSAIQKGITTEVLFQSIETMYEAIDGLNDSIAALARRQNIEIACTKGCHWCCHQAVFASSYEIHYLSEKIKQSFTPEQLKETREKTIRKNELTSALNEKEVLNYKHPCPLLNNEGSCSIYFARPVACRIYLSTNLETCLSFYYHPEDESVYPALMDFPLRAGRMMNEGFKSALKEAGIESAEFRLEEGLKIAFAPDIKLSDNQ